MSFYIFYFSSCTMNQLNSFGTVPAQNYSVNPPKESMFEGVTTFSVPTWTPSTPSSDPPEIPTASSPWLSGTWTPRIVDQQGNKLTYRLEDVTVRVPRITRGTGRVLELQFSLLSVVNVEFRIAVKSWRLLRIKLTGVSNSGTPVSGVPSIMVKSSL